MAEPTVWEGLAKSQGDPTTIEQAIAAIVAAHNADPNAHLDALASLQAHRTNPIADHPADSVVNDKLFPAARTYVAIVGSGADGDFATLDEAVDYAETVGGGNILLMPGTHAVTGALEIPMSINIIGLDRENTVLQLGFTSGNYIKLVGDLVNGQVQSIFRNLTIQNLGGGCIDSDSTDYLGGENVLFEGCDFIGGGWYLRCNSLRSMWLQCQIDLTTNAALLIDGNTLFKDCNFTTSVSSSGVLIADRISTSAGFTTLEMRNCRVVDAFHPYTLLFGTTNLYYLQCYDCFFEGWEHSAGSIPLTALVNSYVYVGPSTEFYFTGFFDHNPMIGSIILQEEEGRVVFTGSNVIAVGNVFYDGYDDNSINSFIFGNRERPGVFTHSNAATAMAFKDNGVVKLTPNSTRTLTTTVPPAGQKRVLIIVTSGTTSYTLTFGSGFKDQGNLSTGTTSGRTFVIEFISDGTQLIETSRTTAMA